MELEKVINREELLKVQYDSVKADHKKPSLKKDK